jgi:hypothetical protein
VIPHFDNSEGGNYDTRFCYLGEPRLLELEAQLPPDVATLGVDEHTAVIIDFDSDTLTVKGRSNGYWRLNGETFVLANSSTTPLSDLREARPSPRAAVQSTPVATTRTPLELAELAARGGDEGRDALATLVQLAATGGDGYIDPTELVGAVLRAREKARLSAQYDLADELRDALVQSGLTVNDGPNGTTWSISGPE